MSRLIVAACLASLTFAGCVEEEASKPDAAVPPVLPDILAPSSEPLWFDPQTFPHPAFNFPTISRPAAGSNVSEWLRPIEPAKLPSPITGLKHVAQAEGAATGRGMSLIGGLAILPASPTVIVDIRDPTHPKAIGEFDANTRGSDTIVYPDGRIVAVLASGVGIIYVVDISDPANPSEISKVDASRTHKVDVVPGTPIVYNSAGREIYDLTVPEKPVKVDALMPSACHRTYFYVDPTREFYRAYCAGYQYTQIWDIADPRKPEIVVSIPMWHANPDLPPTSVTPVTFSHFSIVSHDAKILVVGDEMGGGALAACAAYADTPAKAVSVPTGALWFYDVSDEKNPVLKGWLSPSAHVATNPVVAGCTAHHGRLVPDPEGKRHLLAMGYYGAGVLLVDFTDPANARILDQWNEGTNVWEAWYYQGYVFTGDIARGLDAIGFR